MIILYVSFSLLPLQFKWILSIHIGLLSCFVGFFYLAKSMDADDTQASVTSNVLLQILFIIVCNVQAYVSEKTARRGCLQLHIMLEQKLYLSREKKKNEKLLISMLPVEILQKVL